MDNYGTVLATVTVLAIIALLFHFLRPIRGMKELKGSPPPPAKPRHELHRFAGIDNGGRAWAAHADGTMYPYPPPIPRSFNDYDTCPRCKGDPQTPFCANCGKQRTRPLDTDRYISEPYKTILPQGNYQSLHDYFR